MTCLQPPTTNPSQEAPRLDKFLWAIRFYKTRSLATEAIRGGHVLQNQQPVKPSREVKIGDVYEIKQTGFTRTIKVTALLEKRVGAKCAAEAFEDLTPASEFLKQMQARASQLKREPGAGRPTKRDRRALREFLDPGE